MRRTTPVPEVHLVAATSSEAVRLAPVALEMAAAGRMRPVVVASGQHPSMVRQALRTFGVETDEELITSRVHGIAAEPRSSPVAAFNALWTRRPPSAVLVHADSTATLVAYWRRIPVVHLDAGLRSPDLGTRFPREPNRRLVHALSTVHLSPTEAAHTRLRAQGIPGDRILVVGHPEVDAVTRIAQQCQPFVEHPLEAMECRARCGESRLVLVTMHRRESWGEPVTAVLRAVRRLVEQDGGIDVVLPAHPSPAVREQVRRELSGCTGVLITDPLEYSDLARLLPGCALVLSDSEEIQVRASAFRVPVLVLGEAIQRAGTGEDRILAVTRRVLVGTDVAARMVAMGDPFGDGRAGARIEHALAWLLEMTGTPPEQFVANAGSALVNDEAA